MVNIRIDHNLEMKYLVPLITLFLIYASGAMCYSCATHAISSFDRNWDESKLDEFK